jgi:ferredoxin
MRCTAAELLKSGKAALVIGFEGEKKTRPAFIRKTEDVSRLVWNDRCPGGLARYLLRNGSDRGETPLPQKGKTAIVAKGCDVRAIASLIREGQITRGNVIIIGMDCAYQTARGKKLAQCLVCDCHRPEMSDILIKDSAAPSAPALDAFSDVAEIEKLPVEERLAYWLKQMERCVRCYACRQACPLCYCEECAAEAILPRWLPRSPDAVSNLFFHAMRAQHLAGRCVDCGECERVCPADIPLRTLMRKAIKDMKELYGWKAGADPEAKAPLSTFSPDDPGPGFK